MTPDDIRLVIKDRLLEKRYLHTLEVEKSAVKLAGIYGADKNKASIAALLHDITKELSKNNQLKILKESGIMELSYLPESSKVWHSLTGAIVAEKEFNIQDRDIINSIRYHTTGRKGMSLLEKIIYVADCISDDRDYFGVEKIRELANISLERAILYALCDVFRICREENIPICEDSVEAYNELAKGITSGGNYGS